MNVRPRRNKQPSLKRQEAEQAELLLAWQRQKRQKAQQPAALEDAATAKPARASADGGGEGVVQRQLRQARGTNFAGPQGPAGTPTSAPVAGGAAGTEGRLSASNQSAASPSPRQSALAGARAAAGSSNQEESKSTVAAAPAAIVEGNWVLHSGRSLIYRALAAGCGSQKVAALTLDGVICVDRAGRAFAGNAQDWKWAFPGVPQKLTQLVLDGFTVAIFQNQGNVRSAVQGQASLNARGKVDAILTELYLRHRIDTTKIKVLLATQQGVMRKPSRGMWDIFTKNFNADVAVGGGSPGGLSVGADEADEEDAWDGDYVEVAANEGLVDAFRKLEDIYSSNGELTAKLNSISWVKRVVAQWPQAITRAADLKGVKGRGKTSLRWIDEFCQNGSIAYIDSYMEH